jgi:Asp-tRNA(Asn)/Glu-tRNA(Gln) amidotransferase A subunit family amidase
MLVKSLKLSSGIEKTRNEEFDVRGQIGELVDRVDALDGQVQAMISEVGRRERLLAEVGRLRQRYLDAGEQPALFGALVGVKDIFRVEDFLTRAGTELPADLFAGPEAICVRQLRDAGALVLGKTVTTEFAYFEPGPTRNPHNLGHTPGGSSSGSAAAVAAGFCHLALGTQTVGSVIRPAAFCGIVGFKPSYGRICADGLIFFSPTVDTVGLFAQDVDGMRLAAAVLCRDWDDARKGRKPVLGIPEGPYLEQATAEGLAVFGEQVAHLERVGYQVHRVPALGDIDQINRRHRLLISGEVARVHADWFPSYEKLYRPRTAEIIREGQRVGDGALEEAGEGCLELRGELERVMRNRGIDVWICPSAIGPAPEGLETTGDPIMNLPWTHAGLPALSLPGGQAENGMPVGLQCIGRFMGDEGLLHWGEGLEADLNRNLPSGSRPK